MGLFTLILLIWAGWLTVRVLSLTKRIEQIEEKKSLFTPTVQRTNTEQAVVSELISPQYSVAEAQASAPYESVRDQDSSSVGQFFTWLKEDFLMKIGGLFVFLAALFFLGYAIRNEWIGPTGQVLVVILFGVVVMTLGAKRIQTHENQGAILSVVGSMIMILGALYGSVTYTVFSVTVAYALVFLAITFLAFMSLRYSRNSLALVSLISFWFAPFFIESGYLSMHQYFVYLTILIGGTLWVVYSKEWRNLTLTAIILVAISTAPYMYFGANGEALLWIFLFVGIFFIANIISLLRQRGGMTSPTNFVTALVTAILLWTWVAQVIPDNLQSLVYVAWACVFALGSYAVYRITDVRAPFYVYAGTAVTLIGIATIAELKHDTILLTLALGFEITVLVLTAIKLRLETHMVQALSGLFIIPVVLTIPHFVDSVWYGPSGGAVIHGSFFTIILVALLLLVVGQVMRERLTEFNSAKARPGTVLLLSGFVLLLGLIWKVFVAIFGYTYGVSFTLMVYTVIGIGLYFRGKKEQHQGMRIGGATLLTLVIMRVLSIDVWDMTREGRIITFLVIGVLLLSTAFLSRKHTHNENHP